MKNFIQVGNSLDVVLIAAVASGGVVNIAKLIGVASTDGAIGDTIAVAVEGVYSLPKLGADVITLGAALAWDAAGGTVTATVTGKPLLGYAVALAGTGTTQASVKLCPSAA